MIHFVGEKNNMWFFVCDGYEISIYAPSYETALKRARKKCVEVVQENSLLYKLKEKCEREKK